MRIRMSVVYMILVSVGLSACGTVANDGNPEEVIAIERAALDRWGHWISPNFPNPNRRSTCRIPR